MHNEGAERSIRSDVETTQRDAAAAASRRPSLVRGRLAVIVAFLGLSLSGLGWAVGSPLFSVPDEGSHVIQAAAVARGQLTGTVVDTPGGYYTAETSVMLPQHFDLARTSPDCWRHQPTVTADCSPTFARSGEEAVPVVTYAGNYPPLYYALVGWPSLITDGATGIYLMRIVSAVLCAAVCAAGLAGLRAGGLGTGTWVGAAAALTPMAFFLFGSVNPNGLEVALAFALGCLLLPIALRGKDMEPTVLPRLLVGSGLAAAFLANVRTGSLVWVALVLGLLVVVGGPRRTWGVLRTRAGLVAAVVAVVGLVAALAWIRLANPGRSLGGTPAPELGNLGAYLARVYDEIGGYLRDMVGNFGYLDAPVPLWLFAGWSAIVGALLLLGMGGAGVRARAAVGVGCLGILAIPFGAQFSSVEALGLIWQGRYQLPLGVVLPVVAAALAMQHRDVRSVFVRTSPLLVTVVPLLSLGAIYTALRRHSVGFQGSLTLSEASWTPPVGVLAPLVLVLVGSLLLVAVASVDLRDRQPRESRR